MQRTSIQPQLTFAATPSQAFTYRRCRQCSSRHRLRSGRPFHSAIATSFALEFAAVEEILLPQLMASGATNLLLLTDARMTALALAVKAENLEPFMLDEVMRAAEQGSVEAQYNLGVMYDNGHGVPQNYTTAVKFYERAAEQGHAMAQSNLGVMYRNGRGVAQNYTTAVKFYERAAEQGYAMAQCNLGVMYEQGLGVPQNYTTARQWYEKAAAGGYAGAMANLGIMHRNGQGMPRNLVKAKDYFEQALAAGDEESRQDLEDIDALIAAETTSQASSTGAKTTKKANQGGKKKARKNKGKK